MCQDAVPVGGVIGLMGKSKFRGGRPNNGGKSGNGVLISESKGKESTWIRKIIDKISFEFFFLLVFLQLITKVVQLFLDARPAAPPAKLGQGEGANQGCAAPTWGIWRGLEGLAGICGIARSQTNLSANPVTPPMPVSIDDFDRSELAFLPRGQTELFIALTGRYPKPAASVPDA